jgi:hypothetical protein
MKLHLEGGGKMEFTFENYKEAIKNKHSNLTTFISNSEESFMVMGINAVINYLLDINYLNELKKINTGDIEFLPVKIQRLKFDSVYNIFIKENDFEYCLRLRIIEGDSGEVSLYKKLHTSKNFNIIEECNEPNHLHSFIEKCCDYIKKDK